MASAALLLASPAQIALATGGDEAGAAQAQGSEAALPFSTADVGWLLLVAAVLLVLWVSLQLVAGRRRRALRSVARERTSP
ncbi:MAG: hypothetical protein ACRDPC_20840 [Solirubrobacteraceae bacterium]